MTVKIHLTIDIDHLKWDIIYSKRSNRTRSSRYPKREYHILNMGKLSKVLLKSMLLAATNAEAEPTFQLTSCNSDVSRYSIDNTRKTSWKLVLMTLMMVSVMFYTLESQRLRKSRV